MAMTTAQTWKRSQFNIERREGEEPSTVTFRLSGPFTARDMYSSMSPNFVHNIFDFTQDSDELRVHRFDLTHVPYMDSAGLSVLVSHYARCRANGIRLIVVGAGPRVLGRFQFAKAENLLQATAAA